MRLLYNPFQVAVHQIKKMVLAKCAKSAKKKRVASRKSKKKPEAVIVFNPIYS